MTLVNSKSGKSDAPVPGDAPAASDAAPSYSPAVGGTDASVPQATPSSNSGPTAPPAQTRPEVPAHHTMQPGAVYICIAHVSPPPPGGADGLEAEMLDESLQLLAATRARWMLFEAYVYALLIWLLLGLITSEVAFGSFRHQSLYAWR